MATPPVLGASAKPRTSGAAGASSAAVLREIAARINARLRKSTAGWMHDTINPLWNIDARQAQQIFDFARSGNFAQLEYLYNEVENASPVFSVCVTRRCSALSELDWQVVQSDQRLNRNADASLAKEQIEFVETAIAKIDNLPEALEHFALAAFRGFSVASVWKGADGMPQHLECLDHWNVCLDRRGGRWLWNPGAISFMNPTLGGANSLQEIPAADSIAFTRKRQIDWPAMKIFLRESVGERDWGRFLETYGLPPVILTMPEYTNLDDMETYVEAAAAVFEGKNGAVPFGTNVDFASESRGTNPFTEFIDHQMKLFVLLATGGTLTSLSEAQGIGSGASDAQMDVWKQIVRADVRVVSNAINKQLCERLIKDQKDFRGKPVLAEFRLDTEPPMTADKMLDLAAKADQAGLEIDIGDIQRVCGFTIRRKPQDTGGGMGFNAETPESKTVSPAPVLPVEPSKDDEAKPIAANAGEAAANSPRVASEAAAGANMPPEKETPQKAKIAAVDAEAAKAVEPTPEAEAVGAKLVRSLQADFKDVADRLNAILAKPEAERAGEAMKLLGDIDSLVPDDPAMAEVIREQMEEAFQEQLAKQPEGDAPAANRTMPN